MANHQWLRLGLARGLNGHQLDTLLGALGSLDRILAADSGALGAAGLPSAVAAQLHKPDTRLLEAGADWLARPGNRLLTWQDDDYPPLLREIRDPPVRLFLRGQAGLLQLPQLAVVGSRRATPEGIDNARRFAQALVKAGLGITSGLAAGIDGAAHRGALDGDGFTVAVCGTGPDRIFPAGHRRLADRITARGAVITEYSPGTPVHASQFPERNRLISGLSLGTLVVEAGRRSGALITARLAAEQGREVFAVPGSIHNPVARGCHRLIRNGAKLVETLDDIAEELGPLLDGLRQGIEQNTVPMQRAAGRRFDDPRYLQLLSSLGWEPVNADDLVARSGLTAAEVSSMLLILELAGRVRTLAGGRYQQREEGNHDERDGT